jgi:hypothetical protein
MLAENDYDPSVQAKNSFIFYLNNQFFFFSDVGRKSAIPKGR